ncbi:hypothetical protein CAPTEDRAFT_171089 [Capitella teleta]|uniref:PLD phosphodiesterase domain-containing protein n=1 Tax=Capitella teleta TaxID=283909 RepID=R7VAT3_CAPTE|nr:hypothetical protein CAPTEDRAFT_171089 [Capitella teleta]|eukprot:ELU15958.1 hypothetical protein CAPTEDRAFT_171089 [Capitella teleta]
MCFRLTLVESIPENLTYPSGSILHPSTYTSWRDLIQGANESIDIASFYWTMRSDDLNVTDPSDWQGEAIFDHLLQAGKERGVKIRIAQNLPSPSEPNKDTELLHSVGAAEVRSLNFSRYFEQGGILHTKLWIIDGIHVYIGSANMDWRSLTQVKEMGAVVSHCPCIAQDVLKLFEVYWLLAEPDAVIPSPWPLKYRTTHSMDAPFRVAFNDIPAEVFLSSSPPPFCPPQRTSDIDAILHVISRAQHFVYVAVMDYFPITLYGKSTKFWPVIDDALRKAAVERGVRVRLLASWWSHSRRDLPKYLKSLEALDGAAGASIEVRLFHVPAYSKAQANIPYARVNHNKYMVTDNAAYIGTSNWSADYFISTGGVGLIINQTEAILQQNATRTTQQQLAETFERDWDSSYALPVKDLPLLQSKHRL